MTSGNDYRVRITSTQNDYYTDTSDDYFTITGSSSPTISVTSPNGTETWTPGSTQTIRWSYIGKPENYVKIELLKGGALNRKIASFVSTKKGSYRWKIPAKQAPSNDYRIRITSTTNKSYTDTSDSDFTISH